MDWDDLRCTDPGKVRAQSLAWENNQEAGARAILDDVLRAEVCNPLHEPAPDHEALTLHEVLAEESRMEVETARAVVAMDCLPLDLRDDWLIASHFDSSA